MTQSNGGADKGTRVTKEYVESLIAFTQYHHFPNTKVTVCCITLKTGFAVVAESICGMGLDFDEGIGKRSAYSKAIEKLYAYESYVRRRALHNLGILTESCTAEEQG